MSDILLYGLTTAQKEAKANQRAAASLEAYIARVEADGGTVEISNSLLLAFGMTQYYADWWWAIYRAEEDSGTWEGQNLMLATFKAYYA